MDAQPQIILITGANRGIGFAITQQMALRLPSSTHILACRSVESGETAIQELRKEGVTANLDVVELDVTSDNTILKAKEYIEKKYGRLDGLSLASSTFHMTRLLTSPATPKCW